jgi:2-polyprenyl-3-methyl-5-hydroxy-6-metoxy-1,4-benzoquinol methylase
MPTEEELTEYYQYEYRTEPADTPRMQKYFQATTDHRMMLLTGLVTRDEDGEAHHVLPQTGAALDIGCGSGHWVNALEGRGWVAHGREIKLDYGLDHKSCVKGGVGVMQYDLITFFHSLEHMRDPVDQLRKAASWLKDDGVIWIEVPDLDHPLDDKILNEYVKPHLYIYNKSTLDDVVRKAGLDNVSVAGIQCAYTRRISQHVFAQKAESE